MPGSTAQTFDRVVDFVATGGYALRTYERYARIRPTKDGKWRIANPRVAQQYRLNVGTIVEMPELNVRYVRRGQGHGGARRAGARQDRGILRWSRSRPGDTFLFAGKVLRFEGIRENECFVSNGAGARIQRSVYAGGKFPLSTYLAEQVRGMLADPGALEAAARAGGGLAAAAEGEVGAAAAGASFWSKPFRAATATTWLPIRSKGRLAHQTLGMLLTRRLERAGARPLGFVATDYSLAVWALDDMGRDVPARASRRSRSCSTRTCLATISTPGWPRAGCSSACSATAR